MSTSSDKIISDLTVECCHHKIIHFRMLSSLICDVIILHSVISGSPMALPELCKNLNRFSLSRSSGKWALCWLYCQLENLGFFSTIKNMFTLVMFLDEWWWGTTLGNCCSNPSCEKWEGKHVRTQCKGIVSKQVQWTQKCNDGTNTENDCLKCLLVFLFVYNNKALNHGCDKHIHSSNHCCDYLQFCVRFPHTTLVQLLCLLNLNLTNVLYGTWPGVLRRFGGSSYKV